MEFQTMEMDVFSGVEFTRQVLSVRRSLQSVLCACHSPACCLLLVWCWTRGDKMDGKMAAIIPRSISEWARTQRELLKLERDEEKSQVADTIAQLSAQVTAVLPCAIDAC